MQHVTTNASRAL